MKHYLFVQAYENPIEKAMEFQRIMQEENLNQGQLARKLGISRVRVWQLLNLLKLPEDQQKYILEYGNKEMITERSLRDGIQHNLQASKSSLSLDSIL